MSHKSYLQNYIDFKKRYKGRGKPVHIPPDNHQLAKINVENNVTRNILRVRVPLALKIAKMNQLNFNKKRLEYLWDNKLDLSKTQVECPA